MPHQTADQKLERKQRGLAQSPDSKKEAELVATANRLEKELAEANKESAPFIAAKGECNRMAAAQPFKYFMREEADGVLDWEGFRDLVESTVPIAELAKRKGYTKTESAFLAMWLNDVRRGYCVRHGKGKAAEINHNLITAQRELRTLQRKMLGLPEDKSRSVKDPDPILDDGNE